MLLLKHTLIPNFIVNLAFVNLKKKELYVLFLHITAIPSYNCDDTLLEEIVQNYSMKSFIPMYTSATVINNELTSFTFILSCV